MSYLKRFWNWLLNRTTVDEKVVETYNEVKDKVEDVVEEVQDRVEAVKEEIADVKKALKETRKQAKDVVTAAKGKKDKVALKAVKIKTDPHSRGFYICPQESAISAFLFYMY